MTSYCLALSYSRLFVSCHWYKCVCSHHVGRMYSVCVCLDLSRCCSLMIRVCVPERIFREWDLYSEVIQDTSCWIPRPLTHRPVQQPVSHDEVWTELAVSAPFWQIITSRVHSASWMICVHMHQGVIAVKETQKHGKFTRPVQTPEAKLVSESSGHVQGKRGQMEWAWFGWSEDRWRVV